MIINKFVFPIKADKTFVSGALPQGYLTANDINKDVFYVISPSVGATIIKAKFQNNKQNELPIIVDMLATDIDIKMLVDENASYYDLIKDWNVWQGYFPSKALEYVSYNRAGKIGISFVLKQSILPPLPQLEFKGKLVSEDDKVLENGYYIVDTPLYEIDGKSLTFNDVIIKNDNDIIIRKSIVQSGNTGTVEYGVDPSVYGGVDESIDIKLTDSIIVKVNDNTNEIKYIKLKFDNYYEKNETYNRDEIDNSFKDVNLEIVDLKKDVLGLETDNTLIKERLDDVEDLASNNSGRLDDVDIKDTQQDAKINDLENDKVDKTTTIIGLDLKDDILIGEFKAKLGNATQSVAGLLSAEDKTHLDGLVALLETSDGNNVVDTIGEILEIFQNYPEGADLVTVLQGKVDKVVLGQLTIDNEGYDFQGGQFFRLNLVNAEFDIDSNDAVRIRSSSIEFEDGYKDEVVGMVRENLTEGGTINISFFTKLLGGPAEIVIDSMDSGISSGSHLYATSGEMPSSYKGQVQSMKSVLLKDAVIIEPIIIKEPKEASFRTSQMSNTDKKDLIIGELIKHIEDLKLK